MSKLKKVADSDVENAAGTQRNNESLEMGEEVSLNSSSCRVNGDSLCV